MFFLSSHEFILKLITADYHCTQWYQPTVWNLVIVLKNNLPSRNKRQAKDYHSLRYSSLQKVMTIGLMLLTSRGDTKYSSQLSLPSPEQENE